MFLKRCKLRLNIKFPPCKAKKVKTENAQKNDEKAAQIFIKSKIYIGKIKSFFQNCTKNIFK